MQCFTAPSFAMKRRNLDQAEETRVCPENIIVAIIGSKGSWLTVSSGFLKIQKELLKKERKKKAEKRGTTSAYIYLQ